MDFTLIIVIILTAVLLVGCTLASFVDNEPEEADQVPVLPHTV